ncbi:MAG: LTA synthase family protein [Coprococcus sp.]
MLLFSDLHGLLYPLIISAFIGVTAGLITTSCRPRMNLILTWLILIIRFLLIMVYLIFWKVFKTAFSFSLVIGGTEGANALTEFSDLVINAITDNLGSIILFLLPLIIFLIFTIRNREFSGLHPGLTMEWLTAAMILMAFFTLNIETDSADTYSPQSLYSSKWVKDLSLRKLGFDLTALSDLKYAFFPSLVPQEDFEAYTVPVIEKPEDNMVDIVDVISSHPDPDSDEAVSLYYRDNILDYDFAGLNENEENDDYRWLNQYMASATPTTQNEYTGMFEGYNLILLTAESFSPWAVDEELTPTLYKLVNTGFVMNHFYIPAFNNTSDGEYMVCTGLIPNGQGNHSFQNTSDNDMALCFGNILGPLGYSTNAYHNHTYTFYERDATHPNMGYTYKGYGNGLDVTYVWPESDLEMMEKSMDDYINDEHFHAYYMTVSGHMEYNFTGNCMSYKNYDLVKDLDADEQMQAYIACQIELDRALKYMIQRLEEAGVADKTVIALAPDHYPYAMEDLLTETIDAEKIRWYGLYESNMILWSASMTEPVQVDKVCSSIDIVPTLCNLLGLNYDSRLYIGQDILSDAPGLVVFSNRSFVTDYLIYDSVTDSVKMLSDVTLPENYLDTMQEIVGTKWTASGKILTTDYYAYLKEKFQTDALVY